MVFKYDVLVIGGGHAGCEAATAAANIGAKTCLLTMDMNKIAQMSCNPAVGGIAKGQIVREIDALGGHMGLVTDASAIQFRMLNRSKGPAVWSPRAQCDRQLFINFWRETLDKTDHLDIFQDQAEELLVEKNDASAETEQRVIGVRTIWGIDVYARTVIITAGTFLNGLMHIGKKQVAGGRISEPAVHNFSESITRLGITVARMKTGTPVRIDKRSVHFEDTEEQPGECDYHQFSFFGAQRSLPQLPCWTFNTNEEVHETLRNSLSESPLFNGQIQSTGPRYCPSIETKLVTFPDKQSHPLFLEPEGVNTNEMYLNGFSSSMPWDVQLEAIHKIPALRDAKIYRPGYAIEYDYFDPTQLKPSLESKIVEGLFFAGQVNGTTGYEEAGGQGMVAGINAARLCTDNQPLVMNRDESYIGVLIDDLTTKGVDEPYRMFTSRAEYRILLRQDDADARLTEKAFGGAMGGFTTGKKEIIDMLRQRSRPYLFSNSVAPAIIGASLEMFKILKESDALHTKLMDNVNYFRDRMLAAGFDIKPTQSAICAVMLYDAKLSQDFAAKMQKEGIYVTGFYYPVVPKGQARIRVQLSAGHEKAHLDKAIAAFIKVGKELGVIK